MLTRETQLHKTADAGRPPRQLKLQVRHQIASDIADRAALPDVPVSRIGMISGASAGALGGLSSLLSLRRSPAMSTKRLAGLVGAAGLLSGGVGYGTGRYIAQSRQDDIDEAREIQDMSVHARNQLIRDKARVQAAMIHGTQE